MPAEDQFGRVSNPETQRARITVAFQDAAVQLRERGVAVLRDAFAKPSLNQLRDAATRCFETVRAGGPLPGDYQFNPFSHSLLLTALTDFNGGGTRELTAPLWAAGLGELFVQAVGPKWACRMEQSWVRKKFPPGQVPDQRYHSQNWHQDGALGVRFPLEPGPPVSMTELVTCWIPLETCGGDSPGLEFVARPQSSLLHFTELDDGLLRQRYPPADFQAPILELGDGLVFLNGTLHRTYARREMRYTRMSVEYRIFPAD